MRGITYLCLSDENFESWISIFSHNVEKLTKWVTFLTHIDKFLRVEIQIFPTASEQIWGENNFVSQCRKLWELNFNFVSGCRKNYEANYKFLSQRWKNQEVIDTFVYIAEGFESWIRRLSHYIEEILRWITYLYLSDAIFLELNFNLLSICRKTYEISNIFESIWQISESWITNIVPQRWKSSEVKNNFVSQCRKIWELNFNFVSECRKNMRRNTNLCHGVEKFQ